MWHRPWRRLCPLQRGRGSPIHPHHGVFGRRLAWRLRRSRTRRLCRRNVPLRRRRWSPWRGGRRVHRTKIRTQRRFWGGLERWCGGIGRRRRHRLRLRRPRLHALARGRKNIFRRSSRSRSRRRPLRLWRSRIGPRRLRGRRPLQRANSLLKCQTLDAQQVGRRALAVADDRRQHDRTVDFAAPALPRRRRRGFENSFQIRGNKNLRRSVYVTPVLDLPDMRGHVSGKPRQINVRRAQHARRILILCQRQQQVLERHFRVLLRIGIAGGARKRRSQMLRHRNAPEIIDYHPPEPSSRPTPAKLRDREPVPSPIALR